MASVSLPAERFPPASFCAARLVEIYNRRMPHKFEHWYEVADEYNFDSTCAHQPLPQSPQHPTELINFFDYMCWSHPDPELRSWARYLKGINMASGTGFKPAQLSQDTGLDKIAPHRLDQGHGTQVAISPERLALLDTIWRRLQQAERRVEKLEKRKQKLEEKSKRLEEERKKLLRKVDIHAMLRRRNRKFKN